MDMDAFLTQPSLRSCLGLETGDGAPQPTQRESLRHVPGALAGIPCIPGMLIVLHGAEAQGGAGQGRNEKPPAPAWETGGG